MTAPTLETFFLLSATTNLPLTGVAGSLSFEAYKNEAGTNVTPQPAFIEIGGGLYGFLISFPSPDHGIAYVVSAVAAGGNPQYVYRYARPTDWSPDLLPPIYKIETNKWTVFSTGPNANTLCIFDDDGTTILYQFNLLDNVSAPTTTNPFSRVPV